MALLIENLEDGKGILMSATGDVTGRHVIEANEEILASEPLSSRRYRILDHTGAKNYKVSTVEVQILAKQDLAAWEKMPELIIAIVGDDDLVYGTARMWEGFIGDKSANAGVFRTVDEARTWIASTLSDK